MKSDIDKDCDEFLRFYVKDFPWKVKNTDSIIRKLCEEYLYNDETMGREFLMMYHGWTLHRTKDVAEANIQHYWMKKRMDKIYYKVAKENHWDK